MSAAAQDVGRPAAPAAHPRPPDAGSLVRLGLLSLVWGATYPVLRLGVQGGASPFFLVLLVLVSAAGPTAALGLLGPRQRPTARELTVSFGIGTVLIGGTNVLFFWGIQYSTGGIAAIVFALTPLLAYLVLRLAGGGSPLGIASAVALGLGLLGVALLAVAAVGTSLLTELKGLIALLAGALCQAVGAVLVGRYRPAGEGSFGQAVQFLAGGAVAGAVLLATRAPMALPLTTPVLAALAYLSLLMCVAGYALYFGLVRRGGAVVANLVNFLNPLVALLLGIGLLGEPFLPQELPGLLLVLLALGLFGRARGGSRPSPELPTAHRTPPSPQPR